MVRKITLLIVIGIVVIWACLFGYFKVQHLMNPHVPFDPFGGRKPDIGYIPDDVGITYGLSEQVLGGTDFVVELAGSRKDERKGPPWDYYILRVSRISNIDGIEGRNSYFVRCYKSSYFSAEFNRSTIEDLLIFNAEKQVVSFDLGFTNITCKLPNLEAQSTTGQKKLKGS
ncbi:hypothetical protein P4C99_01725 [Pontiellaceae bacterium B1224]|nr:hypothetical protein [Pontiellaceae bacterium B1224]